MQDLYLIKLSTDYLDQIKEYRNECLLNNSSMDGCGPLRRYEDPIAYINEMKKYEKKETLPEGMVVSTQFLCIRKNDNKLVGMIDVRHYFNDYLEKYAGNIGYSVRPSERQKGVASFMLNAVKPFCKSIGLTKILVSCLDNNTASRKTILKNGGIYESSVYDSRKKETLEHYWITL